MAVNTWKVWQKIGLTKKLAHQDVHPIREVDAIIDFFHVLNLESGKIIARLEQLKELEKERQVTKSEKLIRVNLQSQGMVLDQLLVDLELLRDDTAINDIRMKRLAMAFASDCVKHKQKKLVEKYKEKKAWKFLK